MSIQRPKQHVPFIHSACYMRFLFLEQFLSKIIKIQMRINLFVIHHERPLLVYSFSFSLLPLQLLLLLLFCISFLYFASNSLTFSHHLAHTHLSFNQTRSCAVSLSLYSVFFLSFILKTFSRAF